MRVCPRNAFVPQAHADQAFVDAPIRLDDLDFNISAPHMHATCLEALQLQLGQRWGCVWRATQVWQQPQPLLESDHQSAAA